MYSSFSAQQHAASHSQAADRRRHLTRVSSCIPHRTLLTLFTFLVLQGQKGLQGLVVLKKRAKQLSCSVSIAGKFLHDNQKKKNPLDLGLHNSREENIVSCIPPSVKQKNIRTNHHLYSSISMYIQLLLNKYYNLWMINIYNKLLFYPKIFCKYL